MRRPGAAPAQGVEVQVYSRRGKVQSGPRDPGSLDRVKTDQDGRFRAPITTPGLGVFWIRPKDFAPEMHEIPEDKRGDFGTFRLKTGITLNGRAFDVQGKPLAGISMVVR